MSEDYNYVRGVPDLDDEIKRLRARQAVLVEALEDIRDTDGPHCSCREKARAALAPEEKQ